MRTRDITAWRWNPARGVCQVWSPARLTWFRSLLGKDRSGCVADVAGFDVLPYADTWAEPEVDGSLFG